MKVLGYLNLFGVLALAGLCALQWQVNRRLNLQSISLDQAGQEQTRKISEQDRIIQGYVADLDDFRNWLKVSDAALTDAEIKAVSMKDARDKAAAERDTAKATRDQLLAEREKSVANAAKWLEALKQRDESLKQTNEQIQKLARERNDAIVKFNELANRYNGLVKDLNQIRAKSPPKS